MILEGIATTLNSDGSVNIAPMGPLVDRTMQTLLLRPFRSSDTFANLRRSGCGVFHVVDDVLLLARAAVHRLDTMPGMFPAKHVCGRVLRDACRWYEFTIDDFDDSTERAEFTARVVHAGRLRDVFGFNRAMHAVVEAAILATRVHLIESQEILLRFEELRSPISKTAGPDETAAFELLFDYVRENCSPGPCVKS